jgi:hypothetical protein
MVPQITSELSKTQIKIVADNMVSNILENGNVIEVADTISKMELFIKELKGNSNYINFLYDEVSKYGKSHITSSGTKLELAEVGVKYDYTTCQDAIWNELQNSLESIQALIKNRETFLKAVPIHGLDIINEDGEVLKIYPPSKSSTSSVKCTIQK